MADITAAQIERVQQRLQDCYDALPDDDKIVLEAVLRQAAASDEVEGFAVVGEFQVLLSPSSVDSTKSAYGATLTIPLRGWDTQTNKKI